MTLRRRPGRTPPASVLVAVLIAALAASSGCGDDGSEAGVGGGGGAGGGSGGGGSLPGVATTTTTAGQSSGETVASSSSGAGDDGGRGCTVGDGLDVAPAAKDVGLEDLAVPIDIASVDAAFTFDMTAHAAVATANVTFRMGPDDGFPIFDLRQPIVRAALDGEELDPALLAHHDFGGGSGADLRVVESRLTACSDHTLELSYRLDQPLMAECEPRSVLEWDDASRSVEWDWNLSDLEPGCYAEQWVPANLVFDRFALTLSVDLGSDALPHTLVTNGDVTSSGDGASSVAFPDFFTSLSPLVMLLPTDRVTDDRENIVLDDGTAVEVRIVQRAEDAEDAAPIIAEVAFDMNTFLASTGAWAHGARMTLVLEPEGFGGMEYDGAAQAEPFAIEHEVFHSWYARGVKPARDRDGWIDEAWTVCNTSPGYGLDAVPFIDGEAPLALCPDAPWSRATPLEAYDQGARVFATFAEIMGPDALRATMKAFYGAHAKELVTTSQLERALYCVRKDPRVLGTFHSFVYGRSGAPPPGDPDLCATADASRR